MTSPCPGSAIARSTVLPAASQRVSSVSPEADSTMVSADDAGTGPTELNTEPDDLCCRLDSECEGVHRYIMAIVLPGGPYSDSFFDSYTASQAILVSQVMLTFIATLSYE